MNQRLLDDTLARVRSHLEQNDRAAAIAIIEALRPPDQADVFEELPLGQQEQ